ncbi:MAG: CoA pyrophosphatase [Candidatus Cloacimonetes bacterium]|nr:CoA pyrophosphatase [Candidatus Cloacimonadota bacterium]
MPITNCSAKYTLSEKIDSLKKALCANSITDLEILNSNEFKFASVLLLIAEINGELSFVFQKRNKSIRQGNEVCFPGGLTDRENNETALESVLREVQEEMGISPSELEILGRLPAYINHLGIIIEPFIGYSNIKSLNSFILNKDEVEYIFSVPIAYFINTEPEEYSVSIKAHSQKIETNGEVIDLLPAKKLKLPSSYESIWGNTHHQVLLFRYSNEVIWGITASLIQGLLKKTENLFLK